MTNNADHGNADAAPLEAVTAAPGAGVGPVSRRSLLHHIGVGAATVVVAGIGVGSYRVFDNGVLDAGDDRPYDAWGTWDDDPTLLGAVAAAILAANPHNTQPWLFHLAADSIELFADPTRRTGVLDALDREHHIGLGCALENLVLAAATRGYRATVALLPNPSDTTHVATVSLTKGPREVSDLHDAIGRRHTNRGPYRDKAVAGDVLSTLGSVSSGLDGVSVRWFTTSADRAALGTMIIDATRAIVDDEPQSTESFSSTFRVGHPVRTGRLSPRRPVGEVTRWATSGPKLPATGCADSSASSVPLSC